MRSLMVMAGWALVVPAILHAQAARAGVAVSHTLASGSVLEEWKSGLMVGLRVIVDPASRFRLVGGVDMGTHCVSDPVVPLDPVSTDCGQTVRLLRTFVEPGVRFAGAAGATPYLGLRAGLIHERSDIGRGGGEVGLTLGLEAAVSSRLRLDVGVSGTLVSILENIPFAGERRRNGFLASTSLLVALAL